MSISPHDPTGFDLLLGMANAKIFTLVLDTNHARFQFPVMLSWLHERTWARLRWRASRGHTDLDARRLSGFRRL
jgi:hypothetical protein